MAISFVGSKTYAVAGAASGTHSVSLTDLLDTSGASATLLQNDIVIINYGTGSASDRAYAPPTGYTEDQELYSNGSTFDTNQCIWWKVMGATPDTTVDLPASGATTDSLAATIFAFRGVDTSTPLDVASTTATGTGTINANGPSITPSTAGAWIVVCGAGAAGIGADLANAANLSSTTNHFRSAWRAGSNDATAATGIKTDWASGAFDPDAFGPGATNANQSWAAVTLALRPAAGGSPTTVTITAATQSYSGAAIIVNSRKIIAVTAGAMTYAGQSLSTFVSTIISVTGATMTYAGQSIAVSGAAAVAQAIRRSMLRIGMWMGI